ncbi:hypothetical protein KI387_026566, partial [Taxus chinensis]
KTNHFFKNEEEEDIPIIIGPEMPSQRDLDLEEVLRRFEFQEGNLKLPDDANHGEEEM